MIDPTPTPEAKRVKRAAADVRCALKALGLYADLCSARSELDTERATVALARFASMLGDAISAPVTPANRTASARDTEAALKPTRRLMDLLKPKS